MADQTKPETLQGTNKVDRSSWYAVGGIGALMIVSLAFMQRNWWCPQGDLLPWHWDTWSSHCSQHLIDPYSLSHFQHGLGLLVILNLCLRERCSTFMKITIVAAVECLWEIAENTSFVINRYREATISLDYYGDSIINSTGDYLFCLFGLVVALKLPTKWVVTIFVIAEIMSLVWIRDSLLINIVMLLYPIEAIKNWQVPPGVLY